MKYDSTHGTNKYANDLSITEDGHLRFRDREITLFSTRDPLQLDWASAGAEYIVESTGKMLTMESASQHLKVGGRKVIISAPAK
jgi:glyceraldehyde 3-phosphate dehydrogenase